MKRPTSDPAVAYRQGYNAGSAFCAVLADPPPADSKVVLAEAQHHVNRDRVRPQLEIVFISGFGEGYSDALRDRARYAKRDVQSEAQRLFDQGLRDIQRPS